MPAPQVRRLVQPAVPARLRRHPVHRCAAVRTYTCLLTEDMWCVEAGQSTVQHADCSYLESSSYDSRLLAALLQRKCCIHACTKRLDLRTVVVDMRPPNLHCCAGPKPAPLRNPHTSTTTQYVQLAVNSAMRGSSCDLDRALPHRSLCHTAVVACGCNSLGSRSCVLTMIHIEARTDRCKRRPMGIQGCSPHLRQEASAQVIISCGTKPPVMCHKLKVPLGDTV